MPSAEPPGKGVPSTNAAGSVVQCERSFEGVRVEQGSDGSQRVSGPSLCAFTGVALANHAYQPFTLVTAADNSIRLELPKYTLSIKPDSDTVSILLPPDAAGGSGRRLLGQTQGSTLVSRRSMLDAGNSFCQGVDKFCGAIAGGNPFADYLSRVCSTSPTTTELVKDSLVAASCYAIEKLINTVIDGKLGDLSWKGKTIVSKDELGIMAEHAKALNDYDPGFLSDFIKDPIAAVTACFAPPIKAAACIAQGVCQRRQAYSNIRGHWSQCGPPVPPPPPLEPDMICASEVCTSVDEAETRINGFAACKAMQVRCTEVISKDMCDRQCAAQKKYVLDPKVNTCLVHNGAGNSPKTCPEFYERQRKYCKSASIICTYPDLP